MMDTIAAYADSLEGCLQLGLDDIPRTDALYDRTLKMCIWLRMIALSPDVRENLTDSDRNMLKAECRQIIKETRVKAPYAYCLNGKDWASTLTTCVDCLCSMLRKSNE